MRASKLYGPESIKLETFENVDSITGKITGWESKEFDNKPRVVLALDDAYSLIVSPTNYRVICKAWGDDTNDWIDHRLRVYKGTIIYRGVEQPGICVRILSDDASADPPVDPPVVSCDSVAPARGNGAAELADDIPF